MVDFVESSQGIEESDEMNKLMMSTLSQEASIKKHPSKGAKWPILQIQKWFAVKLVKKIFWSFGCVRIFLQRPLLPQTQQNASTTK